MESIIETFHIDWRIIVAQAVNFALVLAVLYAFALKPLQKVMKERSEKIQKGLADAEERAKLLSAAASERESILGKAREEYTQIIGNAKTDGEAIKHKLLASTMEDIARMQVEVARKQKEEHDRLIAGVRSELGALVVDAIEKSLGDVLDARTQGKMVEQALAAIREDSISGKNH